MDGFYYMILVAALIVSVCLCAIVHLFERRRIGLIVSSCWLTLALYLVPKYFYDVFLLPTAHSYDGIPITGVMRLFMMNDNVHISLNTGIITSLLFFTLCMAFFIFSLIRYIKSR